MRLVSFLFVALVTIVLVYCLNHSFDGNPAMGPLLDPVSGCWANAEPVDRSFSIDQALPALQGKVTVWFDKQMVPHIHADNDHDIYYVEGYLHASFRLWQMDMETRAAAGRVSELIGSKALKFDRTQRRKGMIYAAENSLRAMEADPRTKLMMDAYTAGVNEYIGTLHYKEYPVEYKLMSFAPEPWTNLKSALLLKFMADDLTGGSDDIPLTFLRDMLPAADFDLLYPEKIPGSTPVIPKGTAFAPPSLQPIPVPADSVWMHFNAGELEPKREEGKGSNNWAISGSHTQSGAAILCNDPHLSLNIPSLWYQIQMQTPDMNVYGVSLPGAPGVVIGFNDSIAWGFTNNYRDVKDFYTVNRATPNTYWFNGKQLAYTPRIERIKVKDSADVVDTILYTIQGPIMYDEYFHGPGELKMPLAMCWMAHRPTNELLALYLLNRAKNYNEFVTAILNFQCPAQNMAYADRGGNIAMWGQGQFVNKWKEQGRFIMNGSDSAALWQELIPMQENPHVLNPPQGYVSSANQSVTDSTYPYWYNGDFTEFRAWRINQVLATLTHASINDMFSLQNDTYSILAANTLPIMLHYLPANLNEQQKKYASVLSTWDHRLSAESVAPTAYQIWWGYLYADIWKDEFAKVPNALWPKQERTMQLLQTDTSLAYYDDITTPQHEHLGDIVWRSYRETMDSISKLEKTSTEWYKVKNTTVLHLAKIPAFSFYDVKIGGWDNTVNAAKHDHGPSWRMVVQMGKEIEAYGVYPGGQSGNPGSQYYADFLPNWAAGKYYRLVFLPNDKQQNNPEIKYTCTFHP
jgi:penicillin G amidase